MEQFSYLVGNSGIVFTHNNKSFVLPKNTEGYFKAMALLEKEDASSHAFMELYTEQERKAQSVFGSVALTENVRLDSGILYYKGFPLKLSIAERIIGLIKEGFTPKPMLNFLERLMNNPDQEVVQDLYDFMEKGQIPVTADGHIVCYRAVTADFKDIRTQTMDNSVGAVVTMPRWMVVKDRNVTCAAGLHACSFSYLPHYSHADGKIVEVLIDPADVVSIPTDYDNAKMRVCKFKVLRENTTFYQEHPECVLSKSTFYADKKFQVMVSKYEEGGFEVEYGSDDSAEAYAHWEKAQEKFYRSFVREQGGEDSATFVNDKFSPEEAEGFSVSYEDEPTENDERVHEDTSESFTVNCFNKGEGEFSSDCVMSADFDDEAEARSEAARLAMEEYYEVTVIRNSDSVEICALRGVLRLKS